MTAAEHVASLNKRIENIDLFWKHVDTFRDDGGDLGTVAVIKRNLSRSRRDLVAKRNHWSLMLDDSGVSFRMETINKTLIYVDDTAVGCIYHLLSGYPSTGVWENLDAVDLTFFGHHAEGKHTRVSVENTETACAYSDAKELAKKRLADPQFRANFSRKEHETMRTIILIPAANRSHKLQQAARAPRNPGSRPHLIRDPRILRAGSKSMFRQHTAGLPTSSTA